MDVIDYVECPDVYVPRGRRSLFLGEENNGADGTNSAPATLPYQGYHRARTDTKEQSMMKKALVLWFAIAAGVVAFALLAQGGSAPAQAVEPAAEGGLPALEAFVPGLSTFVTVDEVTVNLSTQLDIRGVVLGGSEAEVRSYLLASGRQELVERCQRLMLLMLTKPGAYLLDVHQTDELFDFSCALRRNE